MTHVRVNMTNNHISSQNFCRYLFGFYLNSYLIHMAIAKSKRASFLLFLNFLTEY